MKPFFSIIIPAFNEEMHIAQCLDSLVGQSLDSQQFEVIVVDDASTDNTASVVSKCATSNNNITLIQHDANKNPGAARNTGIKAAKGNYLVFVDADDKIKYADTLEYLKGILQNCDLQVLLCGNNMPNRLETMSGCDYITTHPRFGVQVWNNVYKASHIKSCAPFVEGHYFEDTRWNTEVIYKADHLGIINYDFYQYQPTPASITRSISDKKIIDNALSSVETRLFADSCTINAASRVIYNRIAGDVLNKPFGCRMHSVSAIQTCYNLYVQNNMFEYLRCPMCVKIRIKLRLLSMKPIFILLALSYKFLYSAKLRLLGRAN